MIILKIVFVLIALGLWKIVDILFEEVPFQETKSGIDWILLFVKGIIFICIIYLIFII